MKLKNLQKKKFVRKPSLKIEGQSNANSEIKGLLLIAIGALIWFSFSFRDSVGGFGRFLTSSLTGIFGFPAYFIPYIIFFFAIIVMFRNKPEIIRQRVNYVLVLLVVLSAMFHTAFYKVSDIQTASLISNFVEFFNKGRELKGGGFIGGIVSIPLLKVFQTLGTIVILTTIGIVDIMVLTDVSLIIMVKKIVKFFVLCFKGILTIKDMIIKRIARTEAAPALSVSISGDAIDKSNNPFVNLLEKDVSIIDSYKMPHTEPASGKLKKKEKGSTESKERKKIDLTKKIANEIEKENELVTQDGYRLPDISALSKPEVNINSREKIINSAMENKKKLEETLASFGVEAKIINITVGPAVTRYELTPSPGVKVSKIVGLADDISLNLASSGIRIEAPIPGKAAIGIEVPNKDTSAVYLSEIISSEDFLDFNSKVSFAVGKDISGENIVADIAKMPHLLIAGATGSGKSVCINSLIVSILYKSNPDEVKLLMIDPKVVELGIYNGIPHLLIPVVTDPKKAAGALNWAVVEMNTRYKSFAEKGVRDILGYNKLMKTSEGETFPQIVIIIDELADLMMVAPNDVEDSICRLAQMARAAGMHLVVATQRPSVDVITGIIKANIPSRIAFAVTSQVDSRTILDMAGAEKLLGKGDMLFYPVGEPKPIRVKGCFISDKDVERVVEFVKTQKDVQYNDSIIEQIKNVSVGKDESDENEDDLLNQAIELVVDTGQASASFLQRKFKVGYARAARIIDQMEQKHVIGTFEGSKPRQVLLTRQQLMEIQFAKKQ